MAYEVFVEFSKPVDDYCEASSYSLGTPMAGHYLAGGGHLNAQLHGFQFTKDRDSLSQAMMAHCLAGTVFDTVWVEIYQAGVSDVYLTYTLSGVVIAAINSGGSGESVGLNWQSMKSAYAGR
jgi:type VI protein secretion system component Hcp